MRKREGDILTYAPSFSEPYVTFVSSSSFCVNLNVELLLVKQCYGFKENKNLRAINPNSTVVINSECQGIAISDCP